MIFTETALAGAFYVDPERHSDERGFFARTWCCQEFAAHGLNPSLVQCSISFNPKKGTLRGMHFQAAPHQETKLVRCTRGSIHDVIVDLRPGSVTYTKWIAAELTEENRRALYVPMGMAHGFLTLSDNAEVLYQISEFHDPASALGVRWNDPRLNIQWPATPVVISTRDQRYEDFLG